MDYPVLNKAPDIAQAVVPHAIDGNGNAVPLSVGAVSSVGGTTPLISGQLVRDADTTPYSPGDHIANSTTGATVTPITFTVTPRTGGSGRLSGGRCVVTSASGTIVLPKFDLLLFRPATNIPFAPGSYPPDNASLNVSAAAMKELIGILQFHDTGWRNQAGGSSAVGDHVYQAVSFPTRNFAPFNLASLVGMTLLGILQAQNVWSPGNVQNTFDFSLDGDAD